MKTLKFKTNINCEGCVAAVKPHLDALGVNWQVDTDAKEKILTVEASAVEEKQVKNAVEEAGYRITSLNAE